MPGELSIGEVSVRSGVSQSALRFYEREGLIAARRTDGNQRRYPSVTLRRRPRDSGDQAGVVDQLPVVGQQAAIKTIAPAVKNVNIKA